MIPHTNTPRDLYVHHLIALRHRDLPLRCVLRNKLGDHGPPGSLGHGVFDSAFGEAALHPI